MLELELVVILIISKFIITLNYGVHLDFQLWLFKFVMYVAAIISTSFSQILDFVLADNFLNFQIFMIMFENLCVTYDSSPPLFPSPADLFDGSYQCSGCC